MIVDRRRCSSGVTDGKRIVSIESIHALRSCDGRVGEKQNRFRVITVPEARQGWSSRIRAMQFFRDIFAVTRTNSFNQYSTERNVSDLPARHVVRTVTP